MGVLTTHIASQFFLPAKHKEAALKSLQNFIRKSPYPENYVWDAEGVLNASSLEDALAAAFIKTSQGPEGDLIELVWGADKLPGETYHFAWLLQSFARFVQAGSYIELEEEFSPCKITFRNKRVYHDYIRYDEYDGSLARARRAFENKKPKDAILYLIDAAEARPEYCMAWVELAKVYAHLKLWDKATEACKKAEEAPQKVYKGLTYVLDYSEQSAFARARNADYLAGEQARQHGEYLIAVPFLQRAANALPKEATIFWELAKALYEVPNYAGCYEAAQNILRLDPGHADGKYYSALALYQMARSEEALPYFAQASKFFHSWLYFLCIYAEAAKEAGDYKKVSQLCERIQRRANKEIMKGGKYDNAWNHAYLAHAFNVLEQWGEAQREAQIAQSLNPESGYILNVLGTALLMQGEVEQAMPHFEKAIQLAPLWEIPKYNLAQCYLKLARGEEATKLFEAALAINKRLAQRPSFA